MVDEDINNGIRDKGKNFFFGVGGTKRSLKKMTGVGVMTGRLKMEQRTGKG
jgi:hypothetical protein